MGLPYAEVIGDPIAHSKSPLIHKFWLESLQLSGDYRPTRVRPNELPDYLTNRRSDPDWRGCNVTMPLKTSAVYHLDELNEEARRLGAVNCILPRRGSGTLYGTNFDAEAVLHTLAQSQWSGRATLLGSGGAARAALWALALLGFEEVEIMSRDPDKALAMSKELGVPARAERLGGAPDCTLLVNATPLGMTGQPQLPISLDNMLPGSTVYEMVYTPLETPLLADARKRGLSTFDGLAMLIEQASMSFASFFDQAIGNDLRAEVRQVLTR
jgi:shikimate dehydrogenase